MGAVSARALKPHDEKALVMVRSTNDRLHEIMRSIMNAGCST